jgi:hypothetical protein
MADRMLSRRDRAACALALECLRQMRADLSRNPAVGVALGSAHVALDAPAVSGRSVENISTALAVSVYRMPARLLRARLALYLRALLRADVGDLGPLWCNTCGWLGAGTYMAGDRCGSCRRYAHGPIGEYGPRRITPLWERAKAHV